MRAIRSRALPTPNGTTMVIGCVGKLWAEAAGAKIIAAINASAIRPLTMTSPLC
jgi:hypothetical protein